MLPCPRKTPVTGTDGRTGEAGVAEAILEIDLDAIRANWRALDARSAATVETGAVVKADAYGLGMEKVAPALAAAGARRFFVALAEEGASLRRVLGPGPEIFVFSGHMEGDGPLLADADLVPLVNSPEQLRRHVATLPGHPFGLQLDSGMNRLGIEPEEIGLLRAALPGAPRLVMSHLACADEPDHPMNGRQLAAFREMARGFDAPLSLAATGGILLGSEYHFDLVRPGIGLYGGRPFAEARPVVRLDLPLVQTRALAPGEAVGYSASWQADRPATIATLSGGYADGILRSLSNRGRVFADGIPCPLAGRVSMDLLTVDVSHLKEVPGLFELLGPHQSIDDLAADAGTIGYEILTALGRRYRRIWREKRPTKEGRA